MENLCAPMPTRPAVEPALVTRAQRALCTMLVAATLAACGPPPRPLPAAASPPARSAPDLSLLTPDLTAGPPLGGAMGFYVPTCLFRSDPGCVHLIFAIGEITPDTSIQFAAFTDALENVLGGYTGRWGVILDSPGGDVASALKLGSTFRTAGWDTVVGLDYPIAGQWRTARCTSACVYTFAGGPVRLILKDNALAVHQFSEGTRLLSVAQVQCKRCNAGSPPPHRVRGRLASWRMTLWRSGGAETAASAATCGTDDLEGALAREHGPLVRVARAVRDRIAPRVQDARPRPRRPASRSSRSSSGIFSFGGGNAARAIVRGAAARVRTPHDLVNGASPQHEHRVAALSSPKTMGSGLNRDPS